MQALMTVGRCCRDRRHSAFLSHHVERLREELREQMSLREFGARTGLPRAAAEQLLACGLLTARLLIMGGPGGGQAYAFQPGDLAGWERPEVTPSEVEEYLNCTAQGVGWLRAGAYLTPINQLGSLTRYCRQEVEAVRRQLITTREIAA